MVGRYAMVGWLWDGRWIVWDVCGMFVGWDGMGW